MRRIMGGDEHYREDAQLSFLPRVGIDWSRVRATRRVWLEETRGDHGARMDFLASQGLRLIMAAPGPLKGGTLHFHNPRDAETLHLRAGEGKSLLQVAVASFPSASRWLRMSQGPEGGWPRNMDASALLDWEGCLVAVEGGRVVRVIEAWMECPGAILSGARAAQACAALERSGGHEGIARSVSFAQACEEARGMKVPDAAMALRSLLMELARAQSHLSWIEEVAISLAKRRVASVCRELRCDLQEMVSSWLGDHLGRGWVVPGGLRDDFPLEEAGEVAASLRELSRRWEAASGPVVRLRVPHWMEKRLEEARGLAREGAFTGPLARASGIEMDVRAEEPGAYALLGWEMVTGGDGGFFHDLIAVKAREVAESLRLARRILECPPERPLEVRRGRGGKGEGFGRCEGPEGEVCCHLVLEKGSLTYLAFSFPGEINRSGARILEGHLLDEAELLFLPWRRMPYAGQQALSRQN